MSGTTADAATLQRQVREHLMLNFTDLSVYADSDIPVFLRSEGCEVIDSHGRRFIDGLSGLYCSNLGHDFGEEIGRAAHKQLATMAYTPTWYVAHAPAAQFAERIANLAPDGMNRVFFTTGGSESNEAMWKFARQWHAANGQPQRRKAIARRLAYHGTSLAALSFTGLDYAREPFGPLPIPVTHVSNTNSYRHPDGADPETFTKSLLDEVEAAIIAAGADEVAIVIVEPVQNSGGSFTPPPGYLPGLRRICDQYGVLLVADEVITGFGRVGEWFGSLRYDVVPDMITFAKGATAAHAPLGGVILHDRVAAPFISGQATYTHGVTFSGHPVSCAIGLAVLDIYEREHVLDNVRENEPRMRKMLEELKRNELVGDVRGAGHFWAVELVKDRDTKETFTGAEADWLLRQVLSARMAESGLLCRLDDRGDPVIQLSPPLVADIATLDRIVSIVGDALDHAQKAVQSRLPSPG